MLLSYSVPARFILLTKSSAICALHSRKDYSNASRPIPFANAFAHSYSGSNAHTHSDRPAERQRWLMQPWHIAMLCIAPLMLGREKTRVWMVMLCASIATYVAWGPVWFMAIDLIAASVVLAKPRGLAQRAIGGVFAAMVLHSLGFFLSPQDGSAQYVTALSALGWVQWLILAIWGLVDGWRNIGSWFGAYERLSDLVARRP